MGTVHLRDNHFDLVREVLTFGPRMAHDDTIEALYYANVHAFAPNMKRNEKEKTWVKPVRKAKPWIVA
tara:strand:- start:399 stop:602 length:204 start_codon:yes stop_codon:yes gene_type:complete